MVSLDSEVRHGLPGAGAEMEARGAWLDHVRTHGEALAALAVEGAKGDPAVKLAADRFRALLRQGHASRQSLLSAPPLDPSLHRCPA